MSTHPGKRPRRKAKQRRAQETVDVVLEASARVLAERGYAAATTNRIAETAGVSVGTVYEYFANKEQVFDALIRRELGALVGALRSQELDADAAIDVKLGQILVAGLGAMRHGPELFRALENVPGAIFRRQLADARALVIAFVKQLLEQHRRELRVPDVDLAAFILVSAIEGVGANATAEQLDDRMTEELRFLLRSYLTVAREPA